YSNPLIVYVGRLISSKRVEDLLQSVSVLRRMGQSATLLIVGDGPEKPTLESIAESLGISQWVYFTGRVAEEGDSAALAVADVAVFAGVHGLAINQAMALGTPVVVADRPGPDGEMVIHQQTGWRFPEGDIEALAEAILDALHSDRRTIIVHQAKHEILERRNLTQYAIAFSEAVKRAQQLCGLNVLTQ
ncbi:MAG: glycosyltransferase, partial [Fimbriimonadales bacterium]